MGEENERATSLVFQYENGSSDAFPLSCIDCLTFGRDSIFVSTLTAKHFGVKYSEMFLLPKTDTLKIFYDTDQVRICNPNKEAINISANESNIKVFSVMETPMVVEVSGTTSNGSLYVQSDSAYTTIFNNITLKSVGRPAFYSALGKKVKIILPKDTENSLCDDSLYVDSLVYANGCLSSLGRVDFEGEGKLTISGNHKHAIYCKKDIKLKNGDIFVAAAVSDGIHSGKGVEMTGAHVEIEGIGQDGIDCDDEFTMTGGSLKLTITADTSKGVKCKKEMTLSGGYVNGLATGGMYALWGDKSYCTILKSDSNIVVRDSAIIELKHLGEGGRCISCKGNFTQDGGNMSLQTHGDGRVAYDYYGFLEYLTPKCMAIDSDASFQRGTLNLLSTGLGGKGIVIGGECTVGAVSDIMDLAGPFINLTTTGESMYSSVEEDQREGCPKGFKTNRRLTINSGYIQATSKGMGGEGIECLDTLVVNGGNIECVCFDDGINVNKHLAINGGAIYCYSEDNDGIDSNGSIEINDGIVVSQSNHILNEGFDTSRGKFYLHGGTIFGLDNSGTAIRYDTSVPYYCTERKPLDNGYCSELTVYKGKRYHVTDEKGNILMSVRSEIDSDSAFFTLSSPQFASNEQYYIFEADDEQTDGGLFGGRFQSGGQMINYIRPVTNFYPTYSKNR